MRRNAKGKLLTIILIILLFSVAIVTCSVLLFYKTGTYSLATLTLVVSICEVLASLVAGAFIVAQLQNEAKSDLKRTKTEEAKFILEQNRSFIENDELTMIEHYLEDQLTHEGTGGINSLREVRQSLVNYLVYLEGFAVCVQQNMMKLSDIDNLFAYRFFLALNNPEVQELEIIPYADFYRGNYQLYDDWYKYRMQQCGKDKDDCDRVMPLAKSALFNSVKYDKYLKDWIDVKMVWDQENNRIFRTEFKYNNKIYVYDKDHLKKIPEQVKNKVEDVIKKNKDFFDHCVGRQLDSKSTVSDQQYKEIAKLIYETDPYIYPALFGSGEEGLNNARIILPIVFESGKDVMFQKQNVFLFCKKEKVDCKEKEVVHKEEEGLCKEEEVVGLILWYRGSINWDPEHLLFIAKEKNIELSKQDVEAVMKGYTGPRYGNKENNNSDDVLYLVNICVDKKYRGIGIGRLMMTEFFETQSDSKMQLCVLQENRGAVHLYEEVGFKIVKESSGFSLDEKKPACYDMKRSRRNQGEINMNELFKCLGNKCPNHCCMAYEGISSKLSSISGVDFTEIILTDEDAEKIREIGREDLIVQKPESDIVTIRTAKDGTCFALKDGRCEIYKARPSICKAYPLYLDFFTGLCYVNDCLPFKDLQDKDINNMRDEIHNLLDVYQYWIDYYKRKLQCADEEIIE